MRITFGPPPPTNWVESVERATTELESMGYSMLIENKKEPRGETMSRFLDPDGQIVRLAFIHRCEKKK
jgi:hypothetical protein